MIDEIFQKQRSISLNSLDGEIDLVLGNKPQKQSTCDKERPSRSPASTHSLNEADFIQVKCLLLIYKRSNMVNKNLQFISLASNI